jgi:hypothetical protein
MYHHHPSCAHVSREANLAAPCTTNIEHPVHLGPTNARGTAVEGIEHGTQMRARRGLAVLDRVAEGERIRAEVRRAYQRRARRRLLIRLG